MRLLRTGRFFDKKKPPVLQEAILIKAKRYFYTVLNSASA